MIIIVHVQLSIIASILLVLATFDMIKEGDELGLNDRMTDFDIDRDYAKPHCLGMLEREILAECIDNIFSEYRKWDMNTIAAYLPL